MIQPFRDSQVLMLRTLVDKIWQQHVVAELGAGLDLLHVDRHLLHDLSGPASLGMLHRRGLRVRNPELCFATPDHAVSTEVGRSDGTSASGARLLPALRTRCNAAGIKLFDIHDPEQGIVHVVGPELGLTLPGSTVLCGDSHTCTHGGLGALGWGIGSSEITHVLATQTIVEQRPRSMRINIEGQLGRGVEAKDLSLHLIGRLGADGGSGYAVEYAGAAIRALSVDARMTVCNLSIELGAKIGIIAPDDTVFTYIAGRRHAPAGALWDRALADWRVLRGDDGAVYDREESIDATEIAPQISWGTSPAHTIGVDAVVPDPSDIADAATRAACREALAYMGLTPGRPLEGVPIDRVFIGSCANGRLSDLEAAAEVVRGKRIASSVVAWVVPGSRTVKRDAEARGLDQVFVAAGFEWREPGCSMCSATNGELVEPGKRCVSTTNRNFVGRQGPGARTHLAGPRMAAAAALAGCITDVRKL